MFQKLRKKLFLVENLEKAIDETEDDDKIKMIENTIDKLHESADKHADKIEGCLKEVKFSPVGLKAEEVMKELGKCHSSMGGGGGRRGKHG